MALGGPRVLRGVKGSWLWGGQELCLSMTVIALAYTLHLVVALAYTLYLVVALTYTLHLFVALAYTLHLV